MKRKKSTIKRTRRSPYERSLEYATKRLAKATEEHAQCQAKLEALNKEIPYLQTVIRALTPRKEPDLPPNRFPKVADMRLGNEPFRERPGILRDVPPIINVDDIPSEEDQFLNVAIPGEKEILS